MRAMKNIVFVLAMLWAGTAISADAIQDRDGQDADTREAATRADAYVKLAGEKYADLEAEYGALLKSYLAGSVPEEEVSRRFAVFSKAPGLDASFDAWVKAYPLSYPAHLARGLFRISEAWRLRGDKFASETTDNQFKGFIEGLSPAEADLNASLKLFAKPIFSYTALIQLSRGRDANIDSGRKLLDQALKIDPKAYGPRMEYQMLLTPKWGGSAGLMEDFLKECNRSALSQENKEKLAAKHHVQLGWQSKSDKGYKLASDEFFQAYAHEPEPRWLLQSGQAAFDGGLDELALQRFDALVKAHPKYANGYTKRGWLFEAHLKNDQKAFNDYLSAAALGNSYAQNRVGWWYMTGRYVSRDYDRAELYLRRAADQKNETALANLKNLDKLRKTQDGAK